MLRVNYIKQNPTMMEISCSGSKDLASSSTLLSAPIRWNLARGRISLKLALNSQFSAETEVERAEWTKEIQRILETPLLPQVSSKLFEVAHLFFSCSGQQSGGVFEQEAERLDCIFQQMISTRKLNIVPVFTLHGTKNWLSVLQSSNKTWFIPKTQTTQVTKNESSTYAAVVVQQ